MTYDHVLYETTYCIPFGITCVHLCFLEGFVLLCVVFCRSLFVLLDLFYGSLYRLSFFHLSLLITTLVSSNFSSYHTRGQHANEYIINETTKTCHRHTILGHASAVVNGKVFNIHISNKLFPK
jgi:hypothetical protein